MFPIAAVRAYLQPVSFLNSLERFLWKIGFRCHRSKTRGIYKYLSCVAGVYVSWTNVNGTTRQTIILWCFGSSRKETTTDELSPEGGNTCVFSSRILTCCSLLVACCLCCRKQYPVQSQGITACIVHYSLGLFLWLNRQFQKRAS